MKLEDLDVVIAKSLDIFIKSLKDIKSLKITFKIKKMDYEDNKNIIKIKFDYNNNKQSIFLKIVVCYNLPLFYFYLAYILDPDKNIVSIIEFDIIQPSLLANFMVISLSFLISTANWDSKNTQNIYIRIPELNHICQTIYT